MWYSTTRCSCTTEAAVTQTLESVIDEAEALQKAKRPADAIALYESALTRWPDQPGLLYNAG